jgi:hypothetical protein
MTFDARSKERLEALGRTLPKKLPLPEPPAAPTPTGGGPSKDTPRHKLEREQDPAELFRALIAASPDGTVPPHLLDRLRELETARKPAPPPSPEPTGPRTSAAPPAGKRRGGRNTSRNAAGEGDDLYTAFAQLLLEEGDN